MSGRAAKRLVRRAAEHDLDLRTAAICEGGERVVDAKLAGGLFP